MKQVSEMPTSGQFVAVWQYKDEVSSESLYWHDGFIYSNEPWGENPESESFYKNKNAIYFIAD